MKRTRETVHTQRLRALQAQYRQGLDMARDAVSQYLLTLRDDEREKLRSWLCILKDLEDCHDYGMAPLGPREIYYPPMRNNHVDTYLRSTDDL